MRIRWTTPAADDLQYIYNYLRENYSARARSTIAEIHASIRSLKKFPHRGRKGNDEGTRGLPHSQLPYIIVYRIADEVVEILHIWHGAQDWQ
jgi:toxin ParE1/3/4